MGLTDTYICVECLAVFKAKADSTQTFLVIPGECPYCSHQVVQTVAHVVARIFKIVELTQRHTATAITETAKTVEAFREQLDAQGEIVEALRQGLEAEGWVLPRPDKESTRDG